MKSNFLSQSLNRVWKVFKSKPWVFTILFIVHVLFIVSFFVVQFKYQVPVAQGLQEIIVGVNEANLDADALQEGADFLPQGMDLYNAYQKVIKNLKLLVTFSLLTISVIGGFSWALVGYLYTKKNILVLWAKAIIVHLLYLVPFSLIAFLLIRSGLFGGSNQLSVQFLYWGVVVLFVIVIHFLFVSLSVLHYKPKKLFKKIGNLVVSRLHWYLASYLLIALFVSPFAFFLYYGVMGLSFWLMMLSVILFVASLVVSQAFLVAFVQVLDKEVR